MQSEIMAALKFAMLALHKSDDTRGQKRGSDESTAVLAHLIELHTRQEEEWRLIMNLAKESAWLA